MSENFDFTIVNKIVDDLGASESSTIAILQSIQEHYRYLPKEIFPHLSERLNISEAKIFGVATFYENFSLEAKGKYLIKVCDGTACHVRKSVPILNALRNHLGLSETKKTTDDMLFTLETVSCLGACGLAPVMTINDEVFPSMTPETATQIIKDLKAKEE